METKTKLTVEVEIETLVEYFYHRGYPATMTDPEESEEYEIVSAKNLSTAEDVMRQIHEKLKEAVQDNWCDLEDAVVAHHNGEVEAWELRNVD